MSPTVQRWCSWQAGAHGPSRRTKKEVESAGSNGTHETFPREASHAVRVNTYVQHRAQLMLVLLRVFFCSCELVRLKSLILKRW